MAVAATAGGGRTTPPIIARCRRSPRPLPTIPPMATPGDDDDRNDDISPSKKETSPPAKKEITHGDLERRLKCDFEAEHCRREGLHCRD
ncbi:hypothetical protein ACLOJK_008029, partial [Asimina triloba]